MILPGNNLRNGFLTSKESKQILVIERNRIHGQPS